MSWTHVTFAESDDKPGVEYEVERRADGAMKCGCMSFRFARGEFGSANKTCKHIREWSALAPSMVLDASTPITRKVNVQVRRKTATGAPVVSAHVETFTFRRAITFGRL